MWLRMPHYTAHRHQPVLRFQVGRYHCGGEPSKLIIGSEPKVELRLANHFGLLVCDCIIAG